MSQISFLKSEIGAQAAWKGFTSQTIYIASRLLENTDDFILYPEDIEDLIIKKDDIVVEAVQIKDLSVDLTLSKLALSKTSAGGDGFFQRMCALHEKFPSFSCIRVVHFGALGFELEQLQAKNYKIKSEIINRLNKKHGLSINDATWLVDSLCFEKVSRDKLDKVIQEQIKQYVPVMAAPDLAKDLLIQYVSNLSKNKGNTSFSDWKNRIHEIGTGLAAMDGFYKEYNKTLVRLTEFQLNKSYTQLEGEFAQGISAHPTHIRNNLDCRREYWLDQIDKALENAKVAIVKGVSGQGKSSLCYRYLIDYYPEECIFCVRSIASEGQAQNLVTALEGLGKHSNNLIIYIDVLPGEKQWAFLLQELQARGLSIPVLVSIRDEDFNTTPVNGKAIKYDLIDLTLTKDEAEKIYGLFTRKKPLAVHRSFDEAWQSFGGKGPLIEFVYILTYNQTLTQRIEQQIDSLLLEGIHDTWIELLKVVCCAGRLGCSVNIERAKETLHCPTMQAAIRRLKNEYLIRLINDNELECLHPVRAAIIYDVLNNQIGDTKIDTLFKTLQCTSSHNIGILLLDYFSQQPYAIDDIIHLSKVTFSDWVGYANIIKSMLWLDTKRYVDSNMPFLQSFIERHGKGWLCFLPLNLSGVEQSDALIAETMLDLSFINKEKIQNGIDEVKTSLTSLSIDYQATDYILKNCAMPTVLPCSDKDRTAFGYSLFWKAKRGLQAELPFGSQEIVENVVTENIQAAADAVRGLIEFPENKECYNSALELIVEKLIHQMCVISFSVTENSVSCKFIPPIFSKTAVPVNTKNINQYWRIRMLDILSQMYPNKEYIDIELIGVDLYQDIGINAMDHKLHIHKKNRPIPWINELNSWVKVRIDYYLRPSTWTEYISVVDKIRLVAHELILYTIKLLDDIYKKGRYTQERWKQLETKIKLFREHTFADNRLPKSAVDPYCLYSEGSKRTLNSENNERGVHSEYYTMHQLLSIGKYEKFIKSMNDVLSSLDNFFTQFLQVLLARIKGKSLEEVDKPRIAMYNLYNAAKSLPSFQKEYNSLFSHYTSLPNDHDKYELESILTLVNIWDHILDHGPHNTAIAYDAKQKYRKGATYFTENLSIAVNNTDCSLVIGEKYAYIVTDYAIDDNNSLEIAYSTVIHKLRQIYQDARTFSSTRWYVENQELRLAFVPVITGVLFPFAYEIPIYKLLDTDIKEVAKLMIPCELEPILKDHQDYKHLHPLWIEGIRTLSEIKLRLNQYQQVQQTHIDEKCILSFDSFSEITISQVEELWSKLSNCDQLIYAMRKSANEQSNEQLNVIEMFINCRNEFRDYIMEQGDPQLLISTIDKVSVIMFALFPLASQ